MEILIWVCATVFLLPVYALKDFIDHRRGKGRVDEAKRLMHKNK